MLDVAETLRNTSPRYFRTNIYVCVCNLVIQKASVRTHNSSLEGATKLKFGSFCSS